MNVLFLSPAFPPNAEHYCTALRARGVNVLGVGDAPPDALTSAAARSLSEYVFEPRMAEYGMLRAAVKGLAERHGGIHRLDSNGEHWLVAEGRLRDEFGVPGLSGDEIARYRSKLGMAEVFDRAGIPRPAGIRAGSPEEVRAFAARHGFPLVFKPDAGSGAADTFVVEDAAALDATLARSLGDHVVQPFIRGDIVTFDGLVDRNGRIVFETSHSYDTGIMQVREGQLDGHYYSLRAIPAALEAVGRRAVEAFGLRERFFHVEFFAQENGKYVALEMNLRPPGGFTTDMMNHACDMDVYDLWAAVLVGEDLGRFAYRRKYHTAHAGRRAGKTYLVPAEVLARELGSTLVLERPIPEAFAETMGDTMYLLRHEELGSLKQAIARVHAIR